MRYEVIPGENNFQLCLYNDELNKVAKIIFETEMVAVQCGESFLNNEINVDWGCQDDIGN